MVYQVYVFEEKYRIPITREEYFTMKLVDEYNTRLLESLCLAALLVLMLCLYCKIGKAAHFYIFYPSNQKQVQDCLLGRWHFRQRFPSFPIL
jgi:hypothetical protein